MKEKLVIPASLKLKGYGITGEEKSWVDLCKTLDIDYKGQSAHRLVKTKYAEVHDAICKDCIYDKPKTAKPVKADKDKAVKPKSKAKALKPAAAMVCTKCGIELEGKALALASGTVSKGMTFVPDGVILKMLCPSCMLNMLLA